MARSTNKPKMQIADTRAEITAYTSQGCEERRGSTNGYRARQTNSVDMA